MTRQANSTVASARPKRTPIAQRNRLDIKNKEPGYSYRLVNDTDDRVARFLEAGYEVCSKESVGAIGDRRVDSASPLGSTSHFSVGKGVTAVAMRIPEDYAKEDQSIKLKEIEELENTMKGDARKASDYGDFNVTR
jgi:hypothetical protein